LNIERLPTPVSPTDLDGLCAMLAECVHSGVSIGFIEPLAAGEIEAYWRKVVEEASSGARLILVAREAPGRPIIGSAQVAFETRANGRHRAEVQKMIVDSPHRRKGVATALLVDLEAAARARKVKLLFLDTSDTPKGARKFYDALGYTYVGGIPGYAMDPDGTPAANAIYYKALR
jgi:ribosomal protein S18 acetylase RimI-like enzyme